MTRYILFDLELGVYLGSFLGFGFWSKLDPAGQDCAVVFESEQEARDFAATWRNPREGLAVFEVECADPKWCTIDECVAAGAPRWDPMADVDEGLLTESGDDN